MGNTKKFENKNKTVSVFIASMADGDCNYYIKYRWSSSIIRLYMELDDMRLNTVNEGTLYGFDGTKIILFGFKLSQKGDIVYLKIINECGEYLYEDILHYVDSSHVLDQSAIIQCPDNIFFIKHVVYDNDNPNIRYILLENLLQRHSQRFIRIVDGKLEELTVIAEFIHSGVSGRPNAQEIILLDYNGVKYSFKYCIEKNSTRWFQFNETWVIELICDRKFIASMSGLITKLILGLLVFPKPIKD